MRRVSDPISYWLREPAPADVADPPLAHGERLDIDVAIVGAGFTGLWSAIALTDTDPTLRIAVLEMETVGFGASGRNGGFCEASLTHGFGNGIAVRNEDLGLVVDLTEASYIDSVGVSLLFELAEKLSERQLRLAVVLPSGGLVGRVLGIVNMSAVADVQPTVEEALSAIRGG